MTLLLGAVVVGIVLLASHFVFENDRKVLSNRKSNLEKEISEIQNRLEYLRLETRETDFPSDLLWKGKTKATAELSLQKMAVDLTAQTAMTLVSFNNSQARHKTQNDIVSFSIEIEGFLDDAFKFLAELEHHTPKVAIETLRIRPSRSQRGSAQGVPIYLQVNLWVFWSDQA
ncbi:GspMb/PilO family protein [Ruegeria atlantica]|uniref:GspMb/PilO family protein n=1 Tax=Ruegeria atlantica TaxID=81569 RepID=UPI001480F8D6|nr:GspMb/PilO family protein [Ruegeria atlantica]